MSRSPPPPYDFGSHQPQESDKENWTEEEVSEVVAKMGKSKVWQKYAAVCLEKNIDGATMIEATLEDLEYYGFKRQHARKVMACFKKMPQWPQL